jgi:hypothetical protein
MRVVLAVLNRDLRLALELYLGEEPGVLLVGMATDAAGTRALLKPNILILWGDDIGWWNISYNNHGLMGYRTPPTSTASPTRARLHRLLRPAELHRRPRRLHHRAEPIPHRPDQGRHAGRRPGPAPGRPDHRRAAQAARLHHRPVRQEPPGRQGRVPAHDARVRRVLRQPLSPERRRGAGEPGLPQGPALQGGVSARAA